jgi:hypothetical protein
MINTFSKDSRSLYQRLVDAGITINNYQSDFYFPHIPATIAILDQAISDGVLHKKPPKFWDKSDNAFWYEVIFEYEPFWKLRFTSQYRKQS